MKIIVSPLFIALLAVAAGGGSATATTYNAVNDFSLAGNPNGSWSYFYGSSKLQTPVVGSGIFTGFNYWYDSQPVPNSVVIGKNTTSGTISFESIVLPVNYLELDPESLSADVRFTVQSAGNYSITGGFLGIDVSEHSHPVEVLDNGVVIFSGTIASYGASDLFNLTETLNAGDVLDFETLTGSTYTNLSTGLSANIAPLNSSTPEPATLWGCFLALAGFVFSRRIKQVLSDGYSIRWKSTN